MKFDATVGEILGINTFDEAHALITNAKPVKKLSELVTVIDKPGTVVNLQELASKELDEGMSAPLIRDHIFSSNIHQFDNESCKKFNLSKAIIAELTAYDAKNIQVKVEFEKIDSWIVKERKHNKLNKNPYSTYFRYDDFVNNKNANKNVMIGGLVQRSTNNSLYKISKVIPYTGNFYSYRISVMLVSPTRPHITICIKYGTFCADRNISSVLVLPYILSNVILNKVGNSKSTYKETLFFLNNPQWWKSTDITSLLKERNMLIEQHKAKIKVIETEINDLIVHMTNS